MEARMKLRDSQRATVNEYLARTEGTIQTRNMSLFVETNSRRKPHEWTIERMAEALLPTYKGTSPACSIRSAPGRLFELVDTEQEERTRLLASRACRLKETVVGTMADYERTQLLIKSVDFGVVLDDIISSLFSENLAGWELEELPDEALLLHPNVHAFVYRLGKPYLGDILSSLRAHKLRRSARVCTPSNYMMHYAELLPLRLDRLLHMERSKPEFRSLWDTIFNPRPLERPPSGFIDERLKRVIVAADEKSHPDWRVGWYKDKLLEGRNNKLIDFSDSNNLVSAKRRQRQTRVVRKTLARIGYTEMDALLDSGDAEASDEYAVVESIVRSMGIGVKLNATTANAVQERVVRHYKAIDEKIPLRTLNKLARRAGQVIPRAWHEVMTQAEMASRALQEDGTETTRRGLLAGSHAGTSLWDLASDVGWGLTTPFGVWSRRSELRTVAGPAAD